jgi:hypothetical protein
MMNENVQLISPTYEEFFLIFKNTISIIILAAGKALDIQYFDKFLLGLPSKFHSEKIPMKILGTVFRYSAEERGPSAELQVFRKSPFQILGREWNGIL